MITHPRFVRGLRRLPVVARAAAAGGGARDSRAAVRDDPRPNGIPERKLVFVDWTTTFKVGGTAEDTVLQSALQPAAGPDGVSVIDHFARRVEHFDAAGRLAWTYGREGQGPDEFTNPRDLKVDADGRAWVMDPGNARLTVLGRDGKAVLRVPLNQVGKTPLGIIPLPGNEAYVLVPDPKEPLVRIAADGRVLERRSFPWKRYGEFDFLATQSITAAEPRSGRWAAAFQVGDGFFTFNGREPSGGRHRFVEAVTFPQVVQQHANGHTITRTAHRPTFAAMSVTTSPERLYVLFAGASGNANRIVDSYSLADGRYLESYLLASEVKSIAWSNGGLYVVQNLPFPALLALRPQGRALP
ncbi:MAG: hypothetical protein ACJ8J0_28385 [Longimicrobiaceae bacterium]